MSGGILEKASRPPPARWDTREAKTMSENRRKYQVVAVYDNGEREVLYTGLEPRSAYVEALCLNNDAHAGVVYTSESETASDTTPSTADASKS